MSRSQRNDRILLEDILESIDRILEYVNGLAFEDFSLDRKTIDAVVRNLEIIGEASKQLSEELKSKNTDVPWKGMIGTRNRIIHEYADVDLGIIWSIIELELQDLKSKLSSVAKDLN